MVPRDPLRQAMGGLLISKGDHALFLIGLDAVVMVDTFDSLLDYQRLFTHVERTMQHTRYVPICSPF